MHVTVRVFQPDDQHVFREPAFLTTLVAGDTQCMALLAKQGVAAVAGSVTFDRKLFGKMHDETAIRVEFTCRVQAADKFSFVFNSL